MRAAPPRRLATLLAPGLALLALAVVASLLWLLPADPARAQENADTTRPSISAGPTITSSPESGDTYGEGESITFAITFSEAVAVTGQPRLRIVVGGKKRWARHDGADGTTLSFAYVVKAADRDDDGVRVGKNQVRLSGGTITDASDNAARLKHPALPNQAAHKVKGTPEPVNSEPQFASDATARSVAENSPAGTTVGDAVAASDADGDTLTYALSGSDAFAIDSAGQIAVAAGAALDYESAASYTLSVTVSDGKDADGNADDTVDDTITVIVSMTNVDEAGAVSLDVDPPQADSPVTATLLDPDGGVTGLAWTWERSPDGSSDWAAVAGATSAAYTPANADADYYLRANAAYADGHGPGKTANSAAAGPVVGVVPPAPDPEPQPQQQTTAPTITSMAITSSPASGDTYRVGEPIRVRVTFSAPVDLRFGGDAPHRLLLTIDLGGSDVTMIATATSPTPSNYVNQTTQDFFVRLPSPHVDTDGISIPANPLTLESTQVSVSATGTNTNASLAYAGLADQAGHKADSLPPAKPTGLTAQAGDGEVTLTWTDPGNPIIDDYIYDQTTDAEFDEEDDRLRMDGSSATTTSYVVTGLDNGTTYKFRIFAVERTPNDQTGAVSEPSDAVTATPRLGAPDITLAYRNIITGEGRLEDHVYLLTNESDSVYAGRLNWLTPDADTGITRYQGRIKIGEFGYSDWGDVVTAPRLNTARTNNAARVGWSGLSPLRKGTAYTVQVRAVAGQLIGVAAEKTILVPLKVKAAATPGDRHALLHFNYQTSFPYAKWQYRRKAGSGSYGQWTDFVGAGWSRSTSVIAKHPSDYRVTGLTNGTEYAFEVRVIGPQGNVVAVTDEMTVTPRPAPSSPTAHTVPADWALIPDGLGTGDRFRLIFISSAQRSSTSTAIVDYDAHVQQAAVNNQKQVDANGVSFAPQYRALVSTATVDARVNTATTGRGVPIYWLGGPKVADNYADFYDGTWDARYAYHERGGKVEKGFVFTGSEGDGTKHPLYFMGSLIAVNGSWVRGDSAKVGGGGPGDYGGSGHIYGLSPVLTVASR